MRTRLMGLTLLFLFLLGPAALGGSSVSKIDSFKLENGLTVLIRHVTSAEDAAVVVLYKVGNRQDPEGRSGMASLIAALYHAAGTARTAARAPESLWPRWPKGAKRALGWTQVAADDHTLLARTLEVKDIAAEVDDAADRMAGLTVTEQDIEKAVSSLVERLDNLDRGVVPPETARLRARELVVPLPHGGRRPGRAVEVTKVTFEEVRKRLKQLYVPANAILSITGEVSVVKLRAQIEKRFGAIASGGPPTAPPPPMEAPARDPKAPPEVIDAPAAKAPAAALALRAPSPGAAPEYAAWLVLVVRLCDAAQVEMFGRPPSTEALLVNIDILQDAEAVYLVWRAAGAADPAASGDRLRSMLSAATTKPTSQADFLRTRAGYNMHFGVAPTEGGWGDSPLGVAHADARRTQLGIDGDALMRLVSAVTAKDLAAAAQRTTAIVVVRPGK